MSAGPYRRGVAVRIYKPPRWWQRIHYELLEDLDMFGFTVPKGFYSDAATTPRWSWSVFPPMDAYAEAAFLHDYLLLQGDVTRRDADYLFWKALLTLGVIQWRAYVMFAAVRAYSIWVAIRRRWTANG